MRVCSAEDACPVQDLGLLLTAISFSSNPHLRVPGQSLWKQSPAAQAAAESLGKAVSCPIPRPPALLQGHLYPCSGPHGASGHSGNPCTGFARHACSASPAPHSQALGASHLGPLHGHGCRPAPPSAHISRATALTAPPGLGEENACL